MLNIWNLCVCSTFVPTKKKRTFSRIQFELEFERLFGHLDITFEEFIRMGGLSAFDITYSGAGGDDTLIDGVVLNDEEALETILTSILEDFQNDNEDYWIARILTLLNDCEIEKMAEHPECAASIALNLYMVGIYSQKKMGPGKGTHNCKDAFRHSLFNDLNAFSCGEDIAREFGTAHECTSPSGMATAMDNINNQIGYDIVKENPNLESTTNWLNPLSVKDYFDEVANIVCDDLANGKMAVMDNPNTTAEQQNNGETFLIKSDECECK